MLHLYCFVAVRDNRDYKFGEADAKRGEVLEVRHLNPFIIDISPIHGIEVVKPNERAECAMPLVRDVFAVEGDMPRQTGAGGGNDQLRVEVACC